MGGGAMVLQGQPSMANKSRSAGLLGYGAWGTGGHGLSVKQKVMGRQPYSGKLLNEVTFSSWSTSYEKERYEKVV